MASTTAVSIRTDSSSKEEYCGQCNTQLCTSYALGILACILIMGGIFLAFYRWDYLWLVVSAAGAVLVLVGSLLHFCGSRIIDKKQQRLKSRRSHVRHNHGLAEQLIPSAPPLGNTCSSSQLSLNMLPPYFPVYDTISVASHALAPSTPVLNINGQNYLLLSVNGDLSSADTQSIVARLSSVLSNATLDFFSERTGQSNLKRNEPVIQTGDQGCQTETNHSSIEAKPPCSQHSFLQTVNGVISLQSQEKQVSNNQTRDTNVSSINTQSDDCFTENLNNQNISSRANFIVSGLIYDSSSRCHDSISCDELNEENMEETQSSRSNVNQLTLETVRDSNRIDSILTARANEDATNESLELNNENFYTVSILREELFLDNSEENEEQVTEPINNEISVSETLIISEEGGFHRNLEQEDLYDVPSQLIRPVEPDFITRPNSDTCCTDEPGRNTDNRGPSFEHDAVNILQECLLVAASPLTVTSTVVESVTPVALMFVEGNIGDARSTEQVFSCTNRCVQGNQNQPDVDSSVIVTEGNTFTRETLVTNDELMSEYIINQSQGIVLDEDVECLIDGANYNPSLHSFCAPPVEVLLQSDNEDENISIRATPPPSYEEVTQDMEITETAYDLPYGTI